MENNGWKKVERIFHAALDLPANERTPYLQKTCAADGELRSEVESLLHSFEQESAFLDEPVFNLGLGALHKKSQKNRAGAKIGFYHLEEKLGAGGMGEVYKAVDTRLNRRVALKFLSETAADDRAARRQLVREAQAAAALEHPNICAVHAVEESDEHSFIVMQYIEGITLAESIEREAVGAAQFKSLARQIVTAVAAAHSHGVIHRDLKPGNIMLTREGQIKILDFGLAKSVRQPIFKSKAESQSSVSSSGLLFGTVGYMSPEQLRGEKPDYRSDIFSIGIILYEMLTRKNPFIRQSPAETIAAILSEEVAPLEKFVPDFPANLRKIVEKCLHKKPDERFQSAAEMLVELDNAESENTGAAALKRRRNFFVKAAFVLVFLLAVLAAAYFYSRNVPLGTLVVLPISSDTAQPENQYLADGPTQSIVN